jgi:hypothetical protein
MISMASMDSTETMKKATPALHKVIWGIEILERLDKSLRLALSVIETAANHMEMNISKVCETLKPWYAFAHQMKIETQVLASESQRVRTRERLDRLSKLFC